MAYEFTSLGEAHTLIKNKKVIVARVENNLYLVKAVNLSRDEIQTQSQTINVYTTDARFWAFDSVREAGEFLNRY